MFEALVSCDATRRLDKRSSGEDAAARGTDYAKSTEKATFIGSKKNFSSGKNIFSSRLEKKSAAKQHRHTKYRYFAVFSRKLLRAETYLYHSYSAATARAARNLPSGLFFNIIRLSARLKARFCRQEQIWNTV